MSKETAGPDDAAREFYAALVSKAPNLTVKGQKMPYTAVNGNMFTFLAADGTICLRLSPEDEAVFREEFRTEPVEQYGSVMKGYAPVPERLAERPDQLADWFMRSVTFAQTLKPKPTKR